MFKMTAQDDLQADALVDLQAEALFDIQVEGPVNFQVDAPWDIQVLEELRAFHDICRWSIINKQTLSEHSVTQGPSHCRTSAAHSYKLRH